MKKTRVYDLPTRLFHWTFAATFLGAFFIAKAIEDNSPLYSYHMLLGLVLVAIVGFRIFWGLIGSRYARFSSFALKPKDLVLYFKNLFSTKTDQRLGHNPASSWAALIMMGLALGLGLTGFLMTSGIEGGKENFEDLHELLANAFIIVVISHVVGVVFHTLRCRDQLGFSMISGKKQAVDSESGIRHSYKAAAVIFVIALAVFIFHLHKNYDPHTQSLKLFGNTLQLGDSLAD